MMRGVLTLVLVLLATVPAVGRVGRIPPTAELDGCVLPAPACPKPRQVVKLRLDKRTIDFGLETLRLGSTLASLRTQSELARRPLSVHGANDLVARLTEGANLRIR